MLFSTEIDKNQSLNMDRPTHESLLRSRPQTAASGKMQMSLSQFSPEVQNVFRAARGGRDESAAPAAREGASSVDAVRDMISRRGASAGSSPVSAALAEFQSQTRGEQATNLQDDPRAQEYMLAIRQLKNAPLRVPFRNVFGAPSGVVDDGSKALFILYVLRGDANCARLKMYIDASCRSLVEHMWVQDVASMQTRPSWLTGVPALFVRPEKKAYLGAEAKAAVDAMIRQERLENEPARQAAAQDRDAAIQRLQQELEAYAGRARAAASRFYETSSPFSNAQDHTLAGEIIAFTNGAARNDTDIGGDAESVLDEAAIAQMVESRAEFQKAAPVR